MTGLARRLRDDALHGWHNGTRGLMLLAGLVASLTVVAGALGAVLAIS